MVAASKAEHPRRHDMGRTPSDDYSPGEPGKYGEPYEMIDEVEGDEGDDD